MYGAIPQHIFMGCCLVKHRDNCTFIFTFTFTVTSDRRIDIYLVLTYCSSLYDVISLIYASECYDNEKKSDILKMGAFR
jgi:hypothetical protein